MKSRRGHRARQFYLMVTLMITLLFAGAAAYCLVWAKQAGDSARESVLYLVECMADAPPPQILAFKAQLEGSGWMRSVRYISPDRAALLLAEDDLNLDLGPVEQELPPLPAMLSVYFRKEAFDTPGILDSLTTAIREHDLVAGIYAQPDLADMLQCNLERIGQILLAIAIAVLLLSGFLMNSLFKLSLYADRREIKTMQLVGASPFAVHRPYLTRHIGLAVVAGILVTALLLALHGWITGLAPWQMPLETVHMFLLLGCGLLGLSILLTFVVTYRVVNKYIFADIETLF